MIQPNNDESHEVNIKSREEIRLSGVREVLSFDVAYLVLDTVQGEVTIEGESMRMETFDTDSGIVELKGRIDSLVYSTEKEKRRGLFGKIKDR